MTKLDPRRDRDVEPAMLDPAALDRITQHIGREGPRLVKMGHRIERLKQVGAVAVACGLAFLMMRGVRPDAVQRDVSQREISQRKLACSTWSPAVGLALGVRGVAIASGEANLKTATPCRTVFELHSGRITIHAKNLGGGSLAVLSGAEIVEVRGTLFSVSRSDESTIVETDEGVVEVLGRSKVKAGRRARVTPRGVLEEMLPKKRSTLMRQEVGLEVEPEGPVQTAKVEPEGPVQRARRKRRKSPVKKNKSKNKPREASVPAPSQDVGALIKKANGARKRGALDEARRYFKAAGQREGSTAEAAWLGLARLELRAGRPRAALKALLERTQRFGAGSLELEATWLRARALDDSGDREGAKTVARRLIESWPKSAQAREVARWLKENK